MLLIKQFLDQDFCMRLKLLCSGGFPDGSVVTESTCQCRRRRFSPWVGKIPWRRKWQFTPVFLPGDSMDRGAWWVTVQGVTKSWTWLSMHAQPRYHTEISSLLREVYVSSWSLYPEGHANLLLIYWFNKNMPEMNVTDHFLKWFLPGRREKRFPKLVLCSLR